MAGGKGFRIPLSSPIRHLPGTFCSLPFLPRTASQTRRFLGGRQPLWGRGVTSSIALIERPEACRAVIALSRPEPGPLTLTSTSLTPYLVAVWAAVSAARWAAKGVLLRLPLKPTVPEEAQQSASPLGSVMVTVVLLNVALMCTTARLTLRRVFRFLALATGPLLPVRVDPCENLNLVDNRGRVPGCDGLTTTRGPRSRPYLTLTHFLDALL